MIDKDDLWQYAQDTIDNMPDDAVDCVELRKCISISYLYAFHYTKERFYNHPKAYFNKYNNYLQHRELQEFFKRMKLDDIAHKIFAVTNTRNKADYDLNKDFNKKKAIFHMKNVNNLLEKMDKISPT